MQNSAPANDSSGYTVVARRYRPRSFSELVGQDHIAHALHTAISSGRVGHAYLFTGARGVGKTSSARIFAKALNVPSDAEGELADDIAHAIDVGEDMDVIEIDGASNRGIEEIRQLRANVTVRPSRSRYKIYIIDEVHMLTNQAFNALLKTLEEPPPHVKFIFCTTDPDKLPITVLSRCQRFDFVPIKLEAIQSRLQEICTAEGYAADADALALIARRAAGSMRDSQSLLEQVMSFADGKITAAQVQELLGIADEGRLLTLAEALADNDPLQAIELVDEASRSGADAGQLAEQLLNYFRDLLAVGVGGGPELLKLANPAGFESLKTLAERWGVQSILSSIQILDEALVRMRSSVAASALLEVALVQICQLAQLASIPALLEAMRDGTAGRPAGSPAPGRQTSAGGSAAASSAAAVARPGSGSESKAGATPGRTSATTSTAAKKKNEVAGAPAAVASAADKGPSQDTVSVASAAASPSSVTSPSSAPAPAAVASPPVTPPASSPPAQSAASNRGTGDPATLLTNDQPTSSGSKAAFQQWQAALGTLGDMLADYAGLAVDVVPNGSDHWNIVFPPGGARPREICEQGERRLVLEQAVAKVVQRPVRLTFSVMPGEAPRPAPVAQPSNNRVQKMREISENPYVKKLCEVLEGEILRVDPPMQNAAAIRQSEQHKSTV